MQQVPGGIVLLMADPDRKVVADPAASGQVGQVIVRRKALQKLADPHGADAGRRCAAPVERPQEIDATVGIVLPAIFAIEDDANKSRRRASRYLANAVQAAKEMIDG